MKVPQCPGEGKASMSWREKELISHPLQRSWASPECTENSCVNCVVEMRDSASLSCSTVTVVSEVSVQVAGDAEFWVLVLG